MAIPLYTITCLRNDVIARDVYECAFTKPEGFTFRPGQFVLFRVPLVDDPTDIQPRAYSIASAPEDPELLFVIKLKPGGRASRWLEEVLCPGVTIDMQGPFGVFCIPDSSQQPCVLVGTGTGVAPFLSIIRSAFHRGDARPLDMVFGARSEEDLFWVDALTTLMQKHEPFRLHLALSQPTPAWTGHRGRVQTLVPLIAPGIAGAHVFICGSPPMVDEVKKLCLEQWGVPKAQVHGEGYV
jgi:ferredoxin-NADP reductase